MDIPDWMESEKLSQRDIAAIIKRNEVRAHRIIRKKCLPTREEMLLIYLDSNGKVDGNDIYGLPKRAKRPKRKVPVTSESSQVNT